MWELLITFAPVVARVLMLLLDKGGMDAQAKKEFLEMISASQDDALAPTTTKDDFKAIRARLKARVNAPVNPVA